jgi:hypothetical protein
MCSQARYDYSNPVRSYLRVFGVVWLTLVIRYSFDDYDVFKSSLDDFKKVVGESEFRDKVVYLGRGEKYEW